MPTTHSLTHSTLLLLYFYSTSTLLCPTIISSSSFVARSSTPSLVPGQARSGKVPTWTNRLYVLQEWSNRYIPGMDRVKTVGRLMNRIVFSGLATLPTYLGCNGSGTSSWEFARRTCTCGALTPTTDGSRLTNGSKKRGYKS
ncbi:uncharacterized protein SEPMUDRAFT_105915 [Sphaerulina musiva SO2202]|uniref:Secreted protein n=1 Tax=Sphaerulina musiva (strain SO2202) TaxID=692275 RepID=M3CPM8_SPHMS|nr:uncharacterized protein SEPMUDRAFT_105915 [Sphaerulina musiva SO2202]EMF15693.1 hypothetical protein SEPMUDRAFT_105915 [Sphaerulina musiva SO2202]